MTAPWTSSLLRSHEGVPQFIEMQMPRSQDGNASQGPHFRLRQSLRTFSLDEPGGFVYPLPIPVQREQFCPCEGIGQLRQASTVSASSSDESADRCRRPLRRPRLVVTTSRHAGRLATRFEAAASTAFVCGKNIHSGLRTSTCEWTRAFSTR